MAPDNLIAIQAEIVATGQTLLANRLVTGTWGNVSTRIPGGELVAITPSGRDYRSLTAEEIVVVDLQGQVVTGGKPSSELPLHLAIYNRRRDVQAIVHTHSVFASACAVARKSIPPVIEDLIQLVGGAVDVAEYALPGTAELAENTVEALADKQAVLLANHGVIGCGATLGEAILACELVEKAAEIYLYANMLGGAEVLGDEDVAVMRRFYLEHYRQRQRGGT
ncbi:MAG: class II aldolase/adducin family protein [Negativicutes bacterium]|nr:class II aldolase/adducin family protein [Negativicutes bacterium]